jgi:ABC-type hemin transport system ATPase subunit
VLKALEIAEQAIEEATDIMHYDDGEAVTALEGWEIERAYLALCRVLVEVHQAIAEARGEQP